MLKKAVALLRGGVRVRVECAFAERVLNICAARGIPLQDLQWLGETTLCFAVARRDYRALRRALDALNAEMRVERVSGAPFFLARFRRRYALLAGLGLCVLILGINACFIWDLQVSGNDTVPAEKILRVLAKNGVRPGTFAFSVHSQELCNRALLELPELCWLTVNVRGCRAHVLVKERIPRPEIVNESTPTNVVARRDALITQVRALDGEARVLRGSTVHRGQLLISGIVDTKGTETPSIPCRFLAGKGEVWGRTWYELSVKIPLTVLQKQYTGERWERYALIWGRKRIKLYGKDSSNIGVNCDKIIYRNKWTLPGGFALPVAWERERYLAYETVPLRRERDEALSLGETALREYLLAQLGADGSVSTAHCSSAVQGDWLLVTLSAECLEQVGQEVPIPVG